MSKQLFRLVHGEARRRAMAAVADAPEGHVVRISEPAKRREQEEKYHAMIGDIARAWTFIGRKWHREDVKRLLVDEFAHAMREAGTPLHHDGHVVPSIDGKRIVQLGIQTRDFWVSEASQFIEFLYAFGSDIDVEWSEQSREVSA